ncbi:hypothetical protein [Methylocystis heyeri]|uniref:Uncharacterized protein n=1 Tax=Methylocystis heyeri TaxID=391905 RepID=A0A6B8KL59_9HYPH|nr:hypothetical protein [Methylocystis heyeri]QGM47510.1 hypothetical protein H2LOC_018475 [Methylocystis heyeri]
MLRLFPALAVIALAVVALYQRNQASLRLRGEPTVADLQIAYDAEVSSGEDALHDKNLKIVGAQCAAESGEAFSCQVGFVKTDEESERIYLDAALVQRKNEGGWKLLRGLCRRLL